jgi:hypothetical protein
MAKRKPYKSPLEKYPKYVKAIGMISIENASMESLLGELLGALLGIHLHIGHVLFFTPKAAIARLELLSNVVDLSLWDDKPLATRVTGVLKRAKAAIGKRHEIIHTLWAENEVPDGIDSPPVASISFPRWDGKNVRLSVLTDLVRDYRVLIEEITILIEDVQASRAYGWKRPWPIP